ncbi:EAL domain-containing protein [Paraburkholderia phymatum]|uniref:Diguanylate cyclase/phosphodiesterase n=1 Tax=Paraburkholderia phymatum (strain DSM 17167 / CIP 108236 / LMG 21445 / STM815) TaxID=391038 RepID=B2JLF0_PARP8|nr:EAL domain-containing protein [Paraburkholderia phymatum]ACC74118.1 diguanylate cyclase/phosphodiesterase [Paraburkholderia phymatum STM815]
MNLHTAATPTLTRSLGRVNLIGVTVALLISGIVLLVYQAVSLRASLTDIARLQAAMVSENVSAALVFGDRRAAGDVLQHMRSLPYVESVAVFDKDDARFVLYAREGVSDAERNEGTLESVSHPRRLSFEDVIVSAPVELNGEHLGTVVLVATTEQMQAQFQRYASFIFGASACALLIARFVMTRMKSRLNDAERRLEYLALTDPLTDLPNRRAFFEELERRIASPARSKAPLTLVLIDVDDFKTINDTLGHGAGDELLKLVAAALKETVRAGDIVSRIGGDEFAVLASLDREPHQSQSTAAKIVLALARPFTLQGRSVAVTASIGYSRFPDDADDVPALVSNADIALYAAKNNGKNTAVAFEHHMVTQAQRRARLEQDLRAAIGNDALSVVYQPQFECRTGKLTGAEALVRWHHPHDGSISPEEFIPIAEGSDLIVLLGTWVMRRACRDAAQWNRRASSPVSVSVNVSARQLGQPTFTHDVLVALAESGLSSRSLVLEVTESLLMENVDDVTELMKTIRAAGVRLSIDDFGTGYSSLSYLQNFPLNELKIDRSFVRSLPESGQPIVTAIISMAHSFGLTVVAEGVEYPAQLAWLVDAQCDVVQGYLTGRPMSDVAIQRLVSAQRETALALTVPAGDA